MTLFNLRYEKSRVRFGLFVSIVGKSKRLGALNYSSPLLSLSAFKLESII